MTAWRHPVTAAPILDQFSEDFLRAWWRAIEKLAERGLVVGAVVRDPSEPDGARYKLSSIEPRVYNSGDAPTVGVACRGVRLQRDGEWGTRIYWAGDTVKLVVEKGV